MTLRRSSASPMPCTPEPCEPKPCEPSLVSPMPFLTIAFPVFDPIAISIGPIAIRWYALAYIGGIVLGWICARALLKNERLWGGPPPISLAQMDDFILW